MIYEFGDYELDLASHAVRRGGAPVPMEPQVFDVLALLVEQRARTVTKEELLDGVWGSRFVSESALTSRIKAARRALGDDGRSQAVIRTVHGRGYQFVAPTTVRGDPWAAASGRRTVPLAPRRQPRTRYARSGGYSIAYQVVGEGSGDDDVVFVPGFVSNAELHWELPAMAGFLERLAQGRRLIVFDKRGTGLSDRVPPDRLPTLEERMDDVRAVMDAAGSARASIFGVSEGGPMAVLFAASYPERVRRLALYGTYVHAPFPNGADLVQSTREWWGTGTIFEYLAPSWCDLPGRRAFLARYERLSATPDAAAKLVGLLNEIDIGPVAPAVTAPTLVVHRTQDSAIAAQHGRALAERIPGAALVEIEGPDHLVFVDHAPILDAVLAFLDARPDEPLRPPAPRVLATLLSIRPAPDAVPAEPPEGDAAAQVDLALEADLEACLDAVGAPPAAGGPRRVGLTADGLLAVVDGPARAIRAAQLVVEGRALRAAVHTAEVELVDHRPSGPGVGIATAASRVAAPGEVLVSRTVRDLVVGSGIELVARGAFPLGGSAELWELYAPSPAAV